MSWQGRFLRLLLLAHVLFHLRFTLCTLNVQPIIIYTINTIYTIYTINTIIAISSIVSNSSIGIFKSHFIISSSIASFTCSGKLNCNFVLLKVLRIELAKLIRMMGFHAPMHQVNEPKSIGGVGGAFFLPC